MERYRNAEGKVCTREELRESFAKQLVAFPGCYETMSFCDYADVSKFEPLTDEENGDLIESANNLKKAFSAFCNAIEKVTETSFNANLCEDYPFSEPFNEAEFTFYAWLERVVESAKNNQFDRGVLY